MYGSAVRAVGWTAGLIVGASMFGLSWATQSVEVPLWGLMVLTFVPTRDFIEAFRGLLNGVQQRVEP